MTEPAPQTMNTAEAAVSTMIRNGIDTVFCLPGVQNDVLFDAFYKNQNALRPIHTRHEQGTAYMALGAAMATGKPAAYAVVPGPGLLNTTAALCTAYACSAPVLALTGQIMASAIGKGIGHLHEIPDQLGVLKSLTKWSDRMSAPQQGADKMQTAFEEMVSGQPRPVGLECAIDVWGQTAPVTLPAGPAVARHQAINPDLIAKAAKLLGAAKNPMIVVGAGAQHASVEVTALAEMLQAPVVAHRMGHGVVDARHPMSLTAVAGQLLWKQVDVLLAIGSRMQLQLEGWGFDKDLTIIRFEADPEAQDRITRPHVAITGDAANGARQLLAAIPAHNAARASRADTTAGARAEAARLLAGMQPQLGLLGAIRRALPEDGIFVDELTQLGYMARASFPVYGPRTFISPGYQGTLGWGVATALGVKVARPDKQVVCVTGDGGFMFNVQELATAVQHRIPVVIVMTNDSAYGNVRRIQSENYGARIIASELRNPDFVKLAESFGAVGRRVSTPEALEAAITAGFREDVPTVIDIPSGVMPNPWGVFRPAKVRG